MVKINKYIKSSPPKKQDNCYVNQDEFEITSLVCAALKTDSSKFNDSVIDTVIELLKRLNGRKLIYSVISNQMYTLSSNKSSSDGKEFANFTANVDKLKDTVLKNEKYKDLHDIIIKLYDHTQLATHQINVFRFNKEEFESMIKNSEEINKKIESVNSQVLSLVALFTAMAFLVFGGFLHLKVFFLILKKSHYQN